MARKVFKSLAAGVAAGLVLGLATGAARAAVYVGEWDPPFDPADFYFGDGGIWFDNMGWRGSISADITGCAPGPGTVTLTPGGGCMATLTQVLVELYQVDDPGVPTLASIDFGGLASVPITGLRFVNGELTQVATDVIGFQLPTSVGSAVPGFDPAFASLFKWGVRFVIDFDAMGDPSGLFFGDDPYPIDRLSGFSGPVLAYDGGDGVAGVNSLRFPPVLTFGPPQEPEPVSVPGTLGLALAALAALGSLRRRDRTARA